MFMGHLPEAVHKPLDYFELREIQLDCRGPLEIDATSEWGFFVKVITKSHDPDDWARVVNRPVRVGPKAWIGSCATLYNCIIGEGAIVGLGSVVRSCEVRPYTIVAGNPAQVIARRVGFEWVYEGPQWQVLE